MGGPQRCRRRGVGGSPALAPVACAGSSTQTAECALETEGNPALSRGMPGHRSWRRRRARALRSRTTGECLPLVPLRRVRVRYRRRGPPRTPDAGRCEGQIWRGIRIPSCINDPFALPRDQAARVGLWITGDNRRPLWIRAAHARVAMTTSSDQVLCPPTSQPPEMQEWTPWLTPRSRPHATATTTSLTASTRPASPTLSLLRNCCGLIVVQRFTVYKVLAEHSVQNVRRFNQLSSWHFVSGEKLSGRNSSRPMLSFEYSSNKKNMS